MRPYLRVQNVYEGRLDLSDVKEMEFSPSDFEKYQLRDGDILLNEGQSAALVGRPAIYRGEVPGACFQNTLVRFQPSDAVSAEYALIVFRAYMRGGRFTGKSVQTTNIAHLGAGRFAKMAFPLPPPAEQKRIVARVEELLALCDELEARQTAAREQRTRLVQSAFDHLTAATTPADFRRHAAFALQHFPHLTATTDSIPALRQAILSLAIGGRFSKNAEAWQQSSLAELLSEPSLNGVSKAPNQEPPGVEILRISAGTSRQDFFVNEEDFRFVELSTSEIEKFRLRPNDLLACRFNGNLRFVGRMSLYRGESGRVQVNPDKLIRFRVNEGCCSPRFVCMAMNSQIVREKIESMCATTAGNIGISASDLKTVSIPVPPLAEQQRIVAKVAELMKWCDELEARLAAAQSAAAALLDSSLHALLAD